MGLTHETLERTLISKAIARVFQINFEVIRDAPKHGYSVLNCRDQYPKPSDWIERESID